MAPALEMSVRAGPWGVGKAWRETKETRGAITEANKRANKGKSKLKSQLQRK